MILQVSSRIQLLQLHQRPRLKVRPYRIAIVPAGLPFAADCLGDGLTVEFR